MIILYQNYAYHVSQNGGTANEGNLKQKMLKKKDHWFMTGEFPHWNLVKSGCVAYFFRLCIPGVKYRCTRYTFQYIKRKEVKIW